MAAEITRLTPFAFNDDMVRVHMDASGNPWFVATDVCRALEINNSRDALSTLDEDERITVGNSDGNPRNGIPHQYSVVSESGLYSLIFRSRKERARQFRKWVTAEVLPAIRKTGRYVTPGHDAATLFSDVPDEVLRLTPSLRERLLSDALQTARLEGEGRDAALRYYMEYCRLVAAGSDQAPPRLLRDPLRIIERDATVRYVREALRPKEGNVLRFGDIRTHFVRWWRLNYPTSDVPSCRILGSVLAESPYPRRKSGSMVYRNVAFRPDAA